MYVGIEKRISLGTKTVISNNIIFNCSVRWQHCCKNKFQYKKFFLHCFVYRLPCNIANTHSTYISDISTIWYIW